jgi:hypothetical protein
MRFPRPVPAVWKEGADGDQRVEAASGDPFFLGFAAGRYFPPATERIDPELITIAPLQSRTAVPRP